MDTAHGTVALQASLDVQARLTRVDKRYNGTAPRAGRAITAFNRALGWQPWWVVLSTFPTHDCLPWWVVLSTFPTMGLLKQAHLLPDDNHCVVSITTTHRGIPRIGLITQCGVLPAAINSWPNKFFQRGRRCPVEMPVLPGLR